MPNNSKPNSLITEKSPLSAPTRPQPRKLASLGKRSLRKSKTRKQAGSCQHRLFDVSLVPRNGPRVL